jgi:hypothetical protein
LAGRPKSSDGPSGPPNWGMSLQTDRHIIIRSNVFQFYGIRRAGVWSSAFQMDDELFGGEEGPNVRYCLSVSHYNSPAIGDGLSLDPYVTDFECRPSRVSEANEIRSSLRTQNRPLPSHRKPLGQISSIMHASSSSSISGSSLFLCFVSINHSTIGYKC